MDFPVCPSCGQSVIDDDAVDCPFCGSSMKAKPGAKPASKGSDAAAKAAAPAAKAGAKSGTTGTAAKTAPAKKSEGDDFPFDTEVPASKTAIQAMPNASKGRTLKVTCPMCETEGYVPPTAAGKEVKCANQKCMVPVFKAPAAVTEAPPPPAPKKSNLAKVGGITAAVMILIGAGLYFANSQPSSSSSTSSRQLSDADKALMMADMEQSKRPVQPTPDSGDLKLGPKGSEKKSDTDTNPKTPDDFIKVSLKQMNDSSLSGDRQRSKAYCRQLAAEACIIAGDTAAAKVHLEQLVKVGSSVNYYRIEPNLELFWQSMQAGDKASATKSLNAAVEDAKLLPKVGRHQMEVASRLAAALVVAGRIPDALTQLEGHQTGELEGQLAARVQMSSDGRVARLTNVRSVQPWKFPQAVAATQSIIVRGFPAEAKAWALGQTNEDAQAECLALWAEKVSAKPAKGAEMNADVAKALEAPLAARVWARAACGKTLAGDTAGAAAALKQANDLLATVAVPSEPDMPTVKQTIKADLPDSVPLVHAAKAAAEIAFALSLSSDKSQEADAAMELALSYARGIAPGLPAVSARIKEADQLGAAGLREMLKKELALKTDDLARQAVGNYRRALTSFETAASLRLNLQIDIVSGLAQAGLKKKAWAVVSDRSVEKDLSRRDDFINTWLTGELMELFRGTETEKIIEAAVTSDTKPGRPDLAVVMEMLRNGKTSEAGEYTSSLDANSGHRDNVALTAATYFASTGKIELVYGFIAKLTDSVLREEAYRLTTALAAQRNEELAAWKQVSVVNQATEKVSICRGIVAGLKSGPAEKDLPEPAFP